jgi:anthranilate synthase component II
MKILVFDNYDSFTYNLVHLIEKITEDTVDVFRNDKMNLDDIALYDRIVLSPGPGIPSEAGLLLPLIRRYATQKPILGVCLGHQAIAEAFGGKLTNLETVYHGVATEIQTNAERGKLFSDFPEVFTAGRYHSWVVDEDSLPKDLRVTARDANNQIMAMEHTTFPVAGVQFHPESIMTEHGELLLRNFLNRY